MLRRIAVSLLSIGIAMNAGALELDEFDIIDLSHAYGEQTLYWPTSPSAFEKETLAFGDSGAGYFYSAFTVCTPEHGGTHLDAPEHFAEGGLPTAELPLRQLNAPAVVIDITDQDDKERNYRLCVDDVTGFDRRAGIHQRADAAVADRNVPRCLQVLRRIHRLREQKRQDPVAGDVVLAGLEEPDEPQSRAAATGAAM